MNVIPELELRLLSFYRASELAGSVLFGRLALHTEIDELRIPLTRHAAEEAEHAWILTQLIQELGHVPVKVTDTIQSEYGREMGLPRSTLEILGLTQVLEKRAVSHYRLHLARAGTDDRIRRVLEQMVCDEAGHLSWIRIELDRYGAANGQGEIEALMRRLHDMDERVTARLYAQSPYREFFSEARTPL